MQIHMEENKYDESDRDQNGYGIANSTKLDAEKRYQHGEQID